MTSGQEGAEPAASGDGTVYLLHLDPPVKHARHYTGWTSNLDERLEAHRAGRGARLLEVVKEAGGSFRLVRTWPGSRALERAIKDRKEAPKLCPECSPHPFPVSRGRAASPAATAPQAEAWELAGDTCAFTFAQEPEADVVPEPETVGDHLQRLRPPRVSPEAYAEIDALTERLINGWRAELDSAPHCPDPEAELELLPPPRRHEPDLRAAPPPKRRKSKWAA